MKADANRRENMLIYSSLQYKLWSINWLDIEVYNVFSWSHASDYLYSLHVLLASIQLGLCKRRQKQVWLQEKQEPTSFVKKEGKKRNLFHTRNEYWIA